MTYVYLLPSIPHPRERYIGLTANLKLRLADHNASRSVHTAKFRPSNLATYHGFADPKKARAFEIYLKSGSGRAFAQKRLWPDRSPALNALPLHSSR
jgi:predicted GIY-YIG superfamily endonuclease